MDSQLTTNNNHNNTILEPGLTSNSKATETQPTEPSSVEPPSKKAKKQQQIGNRTEHGKKILIYIPIGLPGMGKSHHITLLKKLLEERGFTMSVINSDVVRKELMDEMRAKIPGISHQKAYNDTAPAANDLYFHYVEEALAKSEDRSDKLHALFLDKNHAPEAIESLIQYFYQKRLREKFDIKIAIIIPECVDSFKIKESAYPFSLSFLVRCIQRVLQRREHETLVGDKMKMFRVLTAFFHMYKDFKLTEENLKRMGADLVVSLPFTHQEKEVEEAVCKEIGKSFCEVLVTERDFEVDEEKMNTFMDEMEKLGYELKDPDPEMVKKKTIELLDKSFELFEKEGMCREKRCCGCTDLDFQGQESVFQA